jgi:glyoxylase-like metal-dependent hydrolase (beta-lactamase superfamily II)
MDNIEIKAFFDQTTYTVTYIVSDKISKECAIIDSVLNFDPVSGRTNTGSANQLVEYIQSNHLKTVWILESHAHADHLSAAPYLKNTVGGKIAIGSHIKEVQSTFRDAFNMEPEFQEDGSQFDKLLDEGDIIKIGQTEIKVLHTPGHTPACISYSVDQTIFVGDSLFMPDFGTARTDFPGGDAKTLYHSIQKILSYPDETRIFVGHDYKAPGRDFYAWETTVALQKANNIHINDKVTQQQFIECRTTKDASLDMPALILPAVQVNIRAGEMPPKEDNGVSYLKLPINLF